MIRYPVADSEMQRFTRIEEGPLGDKGGPILQPSREREPQFHSHKEQDPTNNLSETGSGFFPDPPIGCQPADILILVLYHPEQRKQSSQPGLLACRTVR